MAAFMGRMIGRPSPPIVLGAAALHIDFFSKATSTQYLADLAVLDRGAAAARRPGGALGGGTPE